MKPGQVFAVDWLDHYESGDEDWGWIEVEKFELEPVLIRTVGFVVKVSDEAVAIANTMRDGQCSAPMVILKAAIVRAEPIALPILRRPKKR